MDYAYIDTSKFHWSDNVKRDYLAAMEWLASQGFENCSWLENGFILNGEHGHITVQVCDCSLIGMVCDAGEINSVLCFGKVEHQVNQLKRMVAAAKAYF